MPILRLWAGTFETSRPSIARLPLLGARKPAIIFRRVVFPDPDGPRSVRNSPFRTARLTSSTARTSFEYVLLTFVMATAGTMSDPATVIGGRHLCARRLP